MNSATTAFERVCSELETLSVGGRQLYADLLVSLFGAPLKAAGFEVSAIPSHAMLDPRMFLLTSGVSGPLSASEQIAYCQTPVNARPAELIASTSADGVLSLPGWGSFEFQYRAAEVSVVQKTCDSLEVRGPDEQTTLLPPTIAKVPGCDIEITDPRDVYLGLFLEHYVDDQLNVAVVPDRDEFARNIANVLSLFQEISPAFHSAVLANVREAIPFTHPTSESFAAFGFHGAIFVNTGAVQDYAGGLVCDVAHQCAHVLLTAAMPDRSAYFTADPDSHFDAGIADPRTVHDVLHGLFTATVEFVLLAAATPVAGQSYGDAAMSRLRRGFMKDLDALRAAAVLSDGGKRLASELEGCFVRS